MFRVDKDAFNEEAFDSYGKQTDCEYAAYLTQIKGKTVDCFMRRRRRDDGSVRRFSLYKGRSTLARRLGVPGKKRIRLSKKLYDPTAAKRFVEKFDKENADVLVTRLGLH